MDACQLTSELDRAQEEMFLNLLFCTFPMDMYFRLALTGF